MFHLSLPCCSLGPPEAASPSPEGSPLFPKHHVYWCCHSNFRSSSPFQGQAWTVAVRHTSVFLRVGSLSAMSSTYLHIGLFCCVPNHSLFTESGMLQLCKPPPKIIAIVITSQTRGNHEHPGLFIGVFRKSQLPMHSKMCETCGITPEILDGKRFEMWCIRSQLSTHTPLYLFLTDLAPA